LRPLIAYVTMIWMRATEDGATREEAKAKLLEAEEEYQRARADDYVTRLIRDEAWWRRTVPGCRLERSAISWVASASPTWCALAGERRHAGRSSLGACCLHPTRSAHRVCARRSSSARFAKVRSGPSSPFREFSPSAPRTYEVLA